MKFIIMLLVIVAFLISNSLEKPKRRDIKTQEDCNTKGTTVYHARWKENPHYNDALENAKHQNNAIGAYLRHPSAETTTIVKTLAKNLESFIDNAEKENLKVDDLGLRAFQIRGTLYYKDNTNLVQSVKDSGEDKITETEISFATIRQLCQDLQTKIEPNKLLSLMGVLGDIGAHIFDNVSDDVKFGKVKAVLEKTTNIKVDLSGLQAGVKSLFAARSPKRKIAVCKAFHRASIGKDDTNDSVCFNKAIVVDIRKGDAYSLKRRGVFGIEGAKEGDGGAFGIRHVIWPWQTVPKDLIESCPKEPWAGHFSGSILETLFMTDLFQQEKDEQKSDYLLSLDTKAGLNTVNRVNNACVAMSSLLGYGMHSAVEVLPNIEMYLGEFDDTKLPQIQSLPLDNKQEMSNECKKLDGVSPSVKCDETATVKITSKLASCTSKKRKLK